MIHHDDQALATVETIPLIRRFFHTKLRWMGEVDKEEFAEAYKAVIDAENPSHRYNRHMSHTDNMLRIYKAVCVKLVRSQLWDPYRVDPEKEEFVLRMVDPIRERLREVWGETICDLVLMARRELLDYNPSGAYGVPMPWDPVARRVLKHSEAIKQFGLTALKCNRLLQNCRCSDNPPRSPQSPNPSLPAGPAGGVAWVDDPPGARDYWDSTSEPQTVVTEDEDGGDREGFEQGPDALGFENWQGHGTLNPSHSPVSGNGPPQGGSAVDGSNGGFEPTRNDPPSEIEYDPPEETEEYLYILIGWDAIQQWEQKQII